MESWNYKPARDQHLTPLARLRSETREPGLVSHSISRCSWKLIRAYFQLYHRLRVVGGEHLPTKPPFVIVANHESHLDALVLGASIPSRARQWVYPIAAGDVFFESPISSAVASTTINALPIWRKRVGGHALDELKQRLHSGDCAYILFPEGGRTRDGKPLRWKPGIGMIVAGTSIPIVPCRIAGCFSALRPESTIPRPCPIAVTVMPPVTFEHVANDREGWEHVAATLRRMVLNEPITA
jgi:1-acyl-sn-glycerol-3-phosphate acyltransferase